MRILLCAMVMVVTGAVAQSVSASPPSFFEPYRVTGNSVYNGGYAQRSGLWKAKYQSGYGTAAVFQTSSAEHYATGSREQGTLTYGPYTLPNDPEIFMSFWYLWDTEPSLYRDIMTVQISDSGLAGPYETLVDNETLRDHHPANKWAAMKWIDLREYAGEQVYIRFSFDTVTSYNNNYKGWKIDFLNIYSSHFSSVFAHNRILDISFDERDDADTVARDYSGNGHHGTITAAGHRFYSGSYEYGGYLDMRTNIDVTIPDHYHFDNLSSFALDFWVRPTASGGFLLSKSGKIALKYNTNQTLTLYVWDGSAWSNATTFQDVPLNAWSHVAIIYDGKEEAVFYIDGEYAGAGTSLGEMAQGAGNLHLGSLWGYSQFFTGYLGDVRLADIDSFVLADVKVMHDMPAPNVYRWGVYRYGGQWARENDNIQFNEDSLGGPIDLNDPLIQNLVAEIGVSTNTITNNWEAWSRIVTIWNWLRDAQVGDTEPCNAHHIGYSVEDLAYQVNMCGGNYTMNNGFCGPRATLVTGLMRLAGIHPSMIARGQHRYELVPGDVNTHAWGAVHLFGRWIPIDATTLGHTPVVSEVRPLSKQSDKFDYQNPITWRMADASFASEGIPMVERALWGGSEIEPILLQSPPHGMRVMGGRVMVAGSISGYSTAPLPDHVVVNGMEVPLHPDNYFITSIPAEYVGSEMDVYVTTDTGLESTTNTVHPYLIIPPILW